MIWKCLHERGLIAVSSVNPNDIVYKIRELNFMVSGKLATILEQKKIWKRIAVIKEMSLQKFGWIIWVLNK